VDSGFSWEFGLPGSFVVFVILAVSGYFLGFSSGLVVVDSLGL